MNGIAPEITKDIFIERENNGLDLRSENKFLLPKANTEHYGHDSLKYFGCKIWNIIPNEMKCCQSAKTFNPIHTPLIFFSITFEVFIVTPSNFVTFPNFYLGLLWDKKFFENMPQCCLGNHFLSVSKFFFKILKK